MLLLNTLERLIFSLVMRVYYFRFRHYFFPLCIFGYDIRIYFIVIHYVNLFL